MMSTTATEFLENYHQVVEKFFGGNRVAPEEFLAIDFWRDNIGGHLFERRHEFLWFIVVAKCVVHTELMNLPEEEKVMVRLLTSDRT